jgi:branched-subunit amino acid ABC-type transport system permease component
MVLEQLIVNGLIAGAIYALMASGFSLVYNVLKFLHIAHGAVYVVGAFGGWWLARIVGLSLPLAIGGALVLSVVAGLLIDFIVYRPIRKRGEAALLMVSFGAFLFVQSLVLLFFGADVKSYGLPIERGLDIAGAVITPLQIWLIVISLVTMLALHAFLKFTKVGKAIRAVSDDEEVSRVVGISPEKTIMFTFALSALLAGVAGVLVGMEQNIEHAMGLPALISALTASVIGGIGNVPAAVPGGFLLGIVENVGIFWLPSGWKAGISFALLIIFLVFRPKGLFGGKIRTV